MFYPLLLFLIVEYVLLGQHCLPIYLSLSLSRFRVDAFDENLDGFARYLQGRADIEM